jgi:hypothetical protein
MPLLILTHPGQSKTQSNFVEGSVASLNGSHNRRPSETRTNPWDEFSWFRLPRFAFRSALHFAHLALEAFLVLSDG